ncbi:11-beta-hydroxysteroid dehydrogenase type 2-like [Stigmatopora argus]
MDEWWALVCGASVLGVAAAALVVAVAAPAWRLLLLKTSSSRRSTPHEKLLPAGDKVVVITGCDSGFGKATARRLDSLGFRVFATVLDADGEGARELRGTCSERLALVQLDITQPAQVQGALERVAAELGSRGLWALVNNAGVCINFGDVELSQMSNFRGCMEVNFFGTLDVTKAFLPLLRRHKGRLVTVSSPAGDHPFPCLAAYGASKAALNLFTDTLRQELVPWGVHVSTILPASYKTGRCSDAAYWEARHRDLLASLPPQLLDDFGADYVGETKELFQRFARCADPDLGPVVDAMERALLEPRPRARYFAGPGVALMYLVGAYFPAALRKRFLQSLFVKKKLAPRALREGGTARHDDNNNRDKRAGQPE